MRLNLGCGKCILPKEEGWVNVDKVALPGVDEVMDLFQFPWPWADNSVDYIMASHIVEHIPHQINKYPMEGFFVFFRQVHRILKPNGFITVICPYGMSTGALQDPTHTRLIVPETFGYLSKTAGEDNWDYDLGYAFEAINGTPQIFSQSWTNVLDQQALGNALRLSWNVGHSIRVDLRPVKVGMSCSASPIDKGS